MKIPELFPEDLKYINLSIDIGMDLETEKIY